MNVNEYAEKVLFSTDLDEKLKLTTETVEFDFRQTKIDSIFDPGRPDSLVMEKNANASRAALPSRASLVDDRNRGTLLHFFANHELLAAELMALALLKFPNAPEAFRRGLFETLREEQKHTLWYLGRMKECGVTLGEFPVSRFFWDTVSTMETPFDYVARLSLTFEQANLDYSRHFGAIMKQAGDPRTAKIMDKIYRDEIEHVGYGLKWFREWKSPNQSDWDAYRHRLQLPLSPSRAKGNGMDFNQQGRLEAGLSQAFVRNLAVYEKSKGRSPNVFYFNPDAEDRMTSQGYTYAPGPKVVALITDLEILQIFLSRQDDVVLMRKPPSLSHLERLQAAGFQLPEIESLDDHGNLTCETSLAERKLSSIKPWSASPELPRTFASHTDTRLWHDDWRDLFSKTAQADRFKDWMTDSRVCRSMDEVNQALALESGSRQHVLKSPISAAGRGVRFCRDRAQVEKTAEKWLGLHDSILLEPAHDRVFDFSVQYEVTPEKITKIGMIRQLIDATGRYRGSVSAPKFCKGLDEDLSRFLMTEALAFFDTSHPMVTCIHQWCQSFGYSGPLGIDSYIYRNQSGELAVRPICEINPRYTMGRVTHEIRRAISPGCAVKFQIQKAGVAEQKSPPILHQSNGKMCAGGLCLNQINENSQFAATIVVDKNPVNL